ncbi:MAG: HAMP domain-containing histidine kinase [Elusimicrobia bacterium]|nr:HAMP domain-containing histidine kinase [Elusimicrobiota bacterium]
MSIRWKYTLMTSALLSGLIAATLAVVAKVQRRVLEAEAQARLETLMAGVVRVAADSISSQDSFMLLGYLTSLQSQRPELRLAEITRRGHTAKVGQDEPGLVYEVRAVGGGATRYTITASPAGDGRPAGRVETGPAGVAVRVDGDATVQVSEPGEAEVVRLRLGFSRAALSAETERAVDMLLRRTLAVGAAFLGLGILVSAFVGRRLAEPLAALASAADAVGRGQADVRVPELTRQDEVGALARRFNAMTANLRELMLFREDLLHTLTHELNTPLAGLRGTLELWQDRRLPADPAAFQESLAMMVSAVGRMDESLGNALRLFRGEAIRPAEATVVWANELLRQARALFGPVASAKRVTLEVSETVASLVADPELVRQIVINLVSNAVKYTPEGGRVDVSLEDQGDRIRLTVSDSGYGIREEDLPHLFTKFYRAGEAGERLRIPGTGLGLSIVKQAVESLGGRIDVASRPRQGSRFTVVLPKSPSLPLRPGDPQRPAQAPSHAPGTAPEENGRGAREAA